MENWNIDDFFESQLFQAILLSILKVCKTIYTKSFWFVRKWTLHTFLFVFILLNVLTKFRLLTVWHFEVIRYLSFAATPKLYSYDKLIVYIVQNSCPLTDENHWLYNVYCFTTCLCLCTVNLNTLIFVFVI